MSSLEGCGLSCKRGMVLVAGGVVLVAGGVVLVPGGVVLVAREVWS